MTSNGAGGTPGGTGEFFLGFVLAIGGGWLLTNQVTVSGGNWYLWGYNSFGMSLIPFLLGTGLLFFNGKSPIGWLLLIAGLAIVFAGVLTNMHIYFQPTSLFNTLLMLVLLVGGIGLMARSLREHPVRSENKPPLS